MAETKITWKSIHNFQESEYPSTHISECWGGFPSPKTSFQNIVLKVLNEINMLSWTVTDT